MAEYKMGTNLMLFKNSKPLACAKSCKFSINLNSLDVSSKDSGYFTEKIGGKISWSCSSDNMFVMNDYKDLVTAMLKRDPISIRFSCATNTGTDAAPNWTQAAGGYTGSVLITSIEANASDGEVATYSISMEGTGAITAV